MVTMLVGMYVLWHNVLGGIGHSFGTTFGYVGNIDVFIVVIGTFVGILAELWRQKVKPTWDGTKKLLMMRHWHKWICWFVLFLSEYGVGKGTYVDFSRFKHGIPTAWALIAANYIVVFFIVGVLEIRH